MRRIMATIMMRQRSKKLPVPFVCSTASQGTWSLVTRTRSTGRRPALNNVFWDVGVLYLYLFETYEVLLVFVFVVFVICCNLWGSLSPVHLFFLPGQQPLDLGVWRPSMWYFLRCFKKQYFWGYLIFLKNENFVLEKLHWSWVGQPPLGLDAWMQSSPMNRILQKPNICFQEDKYFVRQFLQHLSLVK